MSLPTHLSSAPAWIIQKKRDGEELSRSEIFEFIGGILSGEVAHTQATAFLMATFFRGMTTAETVALTEAMIQSGERYSLSHLPGVKADKHSTGGVGDKVSLILAPLAAACGLVVPMMSGRGLGHSGGTLDKLESIPGFSTALDRPRFEEVLRECGYAMIGQSEKVAPADRILYALRDVTATVECIPLITASILSKKAAAGVETLVLDVKVGNGAFMTSLPKAKALAKTLVSVAKKLGIRCRAVLTNMDQPLGYAAGNAIEVRECIEILKGEAHPDASSADLKELTLALCAHMLVMSKKATSFSVAKKLASKKLHDGSALEVFLKGTLAQGGKLTVENALEQLPLGANTFTFVASKKGYLTQIQTAQMGRLLIELGGGRRLTSDKIDPGAGLFFHKKVGSPVKAGEKLVTVYYNTSSLRSSSRTSTEIENWLKDWLRGAITIGPSRKAVPKLIFAQY